jgi:uncharacterized protein (DUF433 family)
MKKGRQRTYLDDHSSRRVDCDTREFCQTCVISVSRRRFDLDGLASRITVTPGVRSGEPCIRNLRITVWDVLKWLGSGATHAQIIADYPELTEEDILAALQWAAALKGSTAACS